MTWVQVEDYRYPEGWTAGTDGEARTLWYCSRLEEGEIIAFAAPPFDLPDDDRQFLISRQHEDSKLHKNISYRPQQDEMRGFSSTQPGENDRMHGILRDFSRNVTDFLSRFLAPYAGKWSLDYASFRPQEEEGRNLSLHKRNDLLHVDAFPSRPTRGSRILRVFTNVNPEQSRIWLTTDRFAALAGRYAEDAGLSKIASNPPSVFQRLIGGVTGAPDRSPYDRFMLRFHDYMKENNEFQEKCDKIRLEFPPNTTWMVFTDAVPHAALSGRFALEQTYILPANALLNPELAPLRVLEKLCSKPLA